MNKWTYENQTPLYVFRKHRTVLMPPPPYIIVGNKKKEKGTVNIGYSIDKTDESVYECLKWIQKQNFDSDRYRKNLIGYDEEGPLEKIKEKYNVHLAPTEKSVKPMEVFTSQLMCPHCKKMSDEANYYSFVSKNRAERKAEKVLRELYGDMWKVAADALSGRRWTPSLFEPNHYAPITRYIYGNIPQPEEGFEKCRCPHCGKTLQEFFDATTPAKGKKFPEDKRIFPISPPLLTNSVLIAATVFDKPEKNQVIISWHYRMFFIKNSAQALFTRDFFQTFIFNTKSGQTYSMPLLFINGGKPIKSKNFPNHVKNITYEMQGDDSLPKSFTIRKEVYKKLFELICEHHGITGEEKDEHYKYIRKTQIPMTKIKYMKILNRFPMLAPQQINTIKLSAHMIKEILSSIKPTDTAEEFVRKAISNTGVKDCKTSRRLISRDVSVVRFFNEFSRLGFKDINLLERFCLNMSQGYSYQLFYNDYMDFPEIRKFVRMLLRRGRDEKALCENFLSTDERIINDAARACSEIKAAKPKLLTPRVLRGNIKDIHDRLFRIVQKIEYENVEISYMEKDKTLEGKFDHIQFSLAKDTDELVLVGQEMGICVGNYRREVLVLRHVVLVGRDENGLEKVCIELIRSKKGYTMLQAKAHCNDPVQEYTAVALKKWVETKGNIDVEKCRDYKHIKEGKILYDKDKIYQSTTPQNNLEMNEDGQIVQVERWPDDMFGEDVMF